MRPPGNCPAGCKHVFAIIVTAALSFLLARCQEECPTWLQADPLADYPYDETLGNETYCNCGTAGRVISFQLGDCDGFPCTLPKDETIELTYDYLSDEYFTKLDLILNLRNPVSGERVFIRFANGTLPVKPEEPISSYIRVNFKDVELCESLWELELIRSKSSNSSEICARATIDLDFEPGFTCIEEGIFPDACTCSRYHRCELLPNGTYYESTMDCPPPQIWCQESLICDYPGACNCSTRKYTERWL